jgi:hypothetical protein
MIRTSTICYDPSNFDHRHDFYRLLKSGTFTWCKNRYALKGQYGDVLNMMLDLTVRYYAEQEFGPLESVNIDTPNKVMT